MAFQLTFGIKSDAEYDDLVQLFNATATTKKPYQPNVAPPKLPVNVTIQMYMKRFTVEDEETFPYFVAEFTMREYWVDARLAHNIENGFDYVTLPEEDKQFQLWTPDAFFQVNCLISNLPSKFM